jgi:long-chain acyl-CoA synthetase
MEYQQSLGRTLPSLLIEAVTDYVDDFRLYHWHKRDWLSLDSLILQKSVTELALGLQNLGLQKGDRISFLLFSDITFCMADLGSLLAGLINVPIDLTQTVENMVYILNHTETKALIVADLSLLDQILPYLGKVKSLRWIIVADRAQKWEEERSERLNIHQSHPDLIPPVCLRIPQLLGESTAEIPPAQVPECIELISLAEVQAKGLKQYHEGSFADLLMQLNAQDLATIIYIAGDTRKPQGVMLTHDNIVSNVITSFRSHPELEKGAKEVALSFLPLTHIFARAFFYGHLWSGHQLYLSDPNHVMRHLTMVKPTIFITVPILLEKVYQKFLHKGNALKNWQKLLFNWGLTIINQYQIGHKSNFIYDLKLKLVRKYVFASLRSLFGNKLKSLISGGAGLDAHLANFFTGVGIPLLQGYGLTETSGVVTYTHGLDNRAGTVGKPIPEVILNIAQDGEVLIKAPFVSAGYYKDPVHTATILDQEGWLHTGDMGEITPEGLLKLTGVKKAHFKLSTGKYVSAESLESQLETSPLIKRAIALAPNHKFCGMLIFPDLVNLHIKAEEIGLKLKPEELLNNACIIALYQSLIDETNCYLPYWSNVRKFKLIDHLPEGLSDAQVMELFTQEIALMYHEENKIEILEETANSCPMINPYSCPTYGKSIVFH